MLTQTFWIIEMCTERSGTGVDSKTLSVKSPDSSAPVDSVWEPIIRSGGDSILKESLMGGGGGSGC